MSRSVAVCQLGARMHYAVPRLLHRAGLLEKLHTDISAQKGWPRALSLLPRACLPAALRRLADRVVPDVPDALIESYTSFGLAYARRRARARDAEELDAAFVWAGEKFCELVLTHGFGKAGCIYTFNTASAEILQSAHASGLHTVTEQTIAPHERELALLAREHELHPGWESAPSRGLAAQNLVARERAEWQHADLIVCGSEFVREQIAECGGPAERCVIVPYGVDETFAQPPRQAHSGPLRVLTVGAIGLRKGSPYVLAAAQLLGPAAEFRMVGPALISETAMQSLRAHVEVCGAVPRAEMSRHFAWADVFLLPSLCEGSATVTYEALAAGLPVIATPNTGSVVRDGRDGFIVPCGDPAAIAEKLSLFQSNSILLNNMSQSAKERARDFTLESYGQRLLATLAPLLR